MRAGGVIGRASAPRVDYPSTTIRVELAPAPKNLFAATGGVPTIYDPVGTFEPRPHPRARRSPSARRSAMSSSTIAPGIGEHRLVRRVVLFLVALCYFAAFASLHGQWPGILGSGGLEPVDALLERVSKGAAASGTLVERVWALPTLLWLHDAAGVSVDACAEAACLAGAALAAAAMWLAIVTRGGGVAPLWAALFVLYLSVFTVGQTFLSFQWDILLLEAGFLCVWLCPALRPSSTDPPPVVVVWLLRFLAFKLMLMSGAVKIQAECPTWSQLTALDYHWATQPLPTRLAWFAARYTSAAARKFGVAATLALEGPMTTTLVAPFRGCRHAGAWSQIALQVLIAATGNYCFFNLLTVALMVSCFDDAALSTSTGRSSRSSASTSASAPARDAASEREMLSKLNFDALPANPEERRKAIEAMMRRERDDAEDERSASARRRRRRRSGGGVTLVEALVESDSSSAAMRSWRRAEAMLSWQMFFAAAVQSALMFRYSERDGLSLAVGATETGAWLSVVVPAAAAYGWIVALPVATAAHAFREARRSRSRAVAVIRVASSAVSLAAAVVFFGVAFKPMASILPGGGAAAPFAAFPLSFADALPSRHLPAVVDASATRLAAKLHVSNGYGLFRRMTGVGAGGEVARPEIVLEASDDGATWVPVDFAHKPGALDAPPTWVAPHQPRLDWQMWFAALGSYQRNPWVVNLAVRLLEGAPEVWGLLAVGAAAPFDATRPPKFVRGVRYAYDFTRDERGKAWWTRDERLAEAYLPVVSLEDPSVRRFIAARGETTSTSKDKSATVARGRPVDAALAAAVGSALAGVVAALDALATRFMVEMVREGGVLHGARGDRNKLKTS